jgi:hypothetical protein
VKRAGSDDSLRCSFCHKSQDVVGKLISSPSDYPRAYICDECIAVCNSILEDSKHEHLHGEFWDRYHGLPEDIQRRADKLFNLFVANPQHPSLQLKPVGELWSARVTDAYRALAIRDEKVFIWFWIGSHDEYMRLLK